jgi:hypothetical protein
VKKRTKRNAWIGNAVAIIESRSTHAFIASRLIDWLLKEVVLRCDQIVAKDQACIDAVAALYGRRLNGNEPANWEWSRERLKVCLRHDNEAKDEDFSDLRYLAWAAILAVEDVGWMYAVLELSVKGIPKGRRPKFRKRIEEKVESLVSI